MKRLLFYISILIFFSLISCKKNSSDDTTPPVITLIGSPDVNHQKGTPYTDEGATALDNIDGDITSKIVVSNLVDVNIEGTYYVTYNVADNAGNDAVEVRRKVDVMEM